MQVLWQLSGFATACLTDEYRQRICLDSVEESIFVARYWEQRTRFVQCRDEIRRIGHVEHKKASPQTPTVEPNAMLLFPCRQRPPYVVR